VAISKTREVKAFLMEMSIPPSPVYPHASDQIPLRRVFREPSLWIQDESIRLRETGMPPADLNLKSGFLQSGKKSQTGFIPLEKRCQANYPREEEKADAFSNWRAKVWIDRE
jgi:hypothetical protein